MTSQMRPLNLTELAQIAISLQALVGAQLQECVQGSLEAGLGFYHDRRMHWLWFDLNSQCPVVLSFLDKPPTRKKVARPLTLFIKSRFVGRRLESVRADLTKGRVLVFGFHRLMDESPTTLEIEAYLIPRAANLIAIDGRASVAESKPKDLPQGTFIERDEPIVRSWDEIKTGWLALQTGAASITTSGPASPAASQQATEKVVREKKFKKAVEKKRGALVRMNEELAFKTSGLHREIGEWLKTNLSLNVPEAWRAYIDFEKSVSWNMEQTFHRAKENERKAAGTLARIRQVEAEVEKLERLGPDKFDLPLKGEHGARAIKESLLAKADARGRRHQIGTDLEVFIGKSAADNLAILRKAQPFDLWLHLRDHAGAHAIMRRTRGRNVTDQELRDAGAWVIEQSLGARAKSMKGERFDLLIVECRYVKPIKGDKLGRVNYSNDRVMSLRY